MKFRGVSSLYETCILLQVLHVEDKMPTFILLLKSLQFLFIDIYNIFSFPFNNPIKSKGH